ncbi:hypothetical protein B0H13DRAFT_2373968 [Mycena leptocephala]|nr:hypothetical protein B0H13DRAFT_2373968 [Mycena leptocephala]
MSTDVDLDIQRVGSLMGRSPQKKSRSHTAPAKSRRGKGGATHNGGGDSPPREKAASKRKVKAPKKADEVEEKENDGGDSGAARAFWDKDATRTERLLDWLTVNVEDRLKLFSDSTQDANEQGRKKQTGKTTKMAYYLKMADAVFSVDASDTVRADYVENPNRYACSVENYLGSCNNELGQTGAGLKPEDVTPESEIANKIAKIKVDFPYWEQLHGFWRTLPNFNPYTVSSEPGQDIADQALALITGDKAMASPPDEVIQDSEQDLFNFAGLERTPDRITESGSEPIPDWSPTPTKTKPIEIDDDDDDTSPPKFQLRPPKKPAALQNSLKGNLGSTSSVSSSSSTVKPRARKRSRADAFAEETEKQNQILQQLGKEKHDRRMVELAVKRQKLEVDLQRDTLAAEERRLAADERRRELRAAVLMKTCQNRKKQAAPVVPQRAFAFFRTTFPTILDLVLFSQKMSSPISIKLCRPAATPFHNRGTPLKTRSKRTLASELLFRFPHHLRAIPCLTNIPQAPLQDLWQYQDHTLDDAMLSLAFMILLESLPGPQREPETADETPNLDPPHALKSSDDPEISPPLFNGRLKSPTRVLEDQPPRMLNTSSHQFAALMSPFSCA